MANETREHEYEIVDHSSKEGETVLGSVWWDGKKVQTSNEKLKNFLKRTGTKRRDAKGVTKLSMDDGIEFLDSLINYFASYISARKADKQDVT